MNNRLAIILFGVYLIFSLIYLISQHGQSSGTRNSGRRHHQAVEDTLDVQSDKQSFRHPDELAKFVIQDDKQEKSEQGRHRKVKGDRPESSNVGIKPVDEEREESYADTNSKSKTSVPKISPQPVSPNSTKRLPKKTSNRTPVGSNVSKKDRPQRFRTSSSGPAVKLAFLLLAHDDPSIKGLEDLLSTLYSKDHVYFIHVDAKLNSPAYFSFYAEWVFKENVVFSSTRFNIKWGSFDIVKAELDLLKLAVEYNHMVAASNNVTNTTVQSQTNDAEVKTSVSGHPVESNVKRSANRKWDFAINLCGSTVAVKPLEKIQDQFAGLDVGANVVFADDVVQVCDWSDTIGKAKDPCDKILARCADPECSRMDKTPNGLLVYKGTVLVVIFNQ
ncbi:hypothetical protein BKA69DRAFT_920798 [Paraphysoderma sedebokerense]|nr:hypothetical protein BKA69DRAFT_920798 [Paraphysoderma sedebokerense]